MPQVCSELDRKWAEWKAGVGHAQVEVDLKHRFVRLLSPINFAKNKDEFSEPARTEALFGVFQPTLLVSEKHLSARARSGTLRA